MLRKFRGVKETKGFLLFLSAIVGLSAGGLATLFHRLARFAAHLGDSLVSPFGSWTPHFLPLIAGALLTLFLAKLPFKDPRGFSGILHAVFKGKGRLSLNNGLAKLGLSFLSIAGRGSVGRESMIAHVAAGIASWLGRLFHLAPRKLFRLIAAAVASSIASIYGAPIAGIVFAVELLVEEVHLTLGPMVIAALGATLIATGIPDTIDYHLPPLPNASLDNILPFLLLGVLAGAVGSLYSKTIHSLGSKEGPRKWSPLGAGIILTLVSIYAPQFLGGGYGAISSMLSSPPSATMALTFVGGKVLLTAVCLAAGWAGGLFGPSLSIGLALGFLVEQWIGLPPGSGLAAGGAAAVAGAVTHAPLALIILAYELTGSSSAFLLVGIAVFSSVLTRDLLGTPNLYQSPFLEPTHPERSTVPSGGISIQDVMDREFETLTDESSLGDLLAALRTTGHRAFLILGKGGLVGLITRTDLLHAVRPDPHGKIERSVLSLPLSQWMIPYDDLVVAYPDEALQPVAARMSRREDTMGQMPVVSRSNPHQVLGLLTREGLLTALARVDPTPIP